MVPKSNDALKTFNAFNLQAIVWHGAFCSNAPKAFVFDPDDANRAPSDTVFNGAFMVTTAFAAHVQDGKMKAEKVFFTDDEKYEWPVGQPGNLYGDTCDMGGKGGLPAPFYETSQHPASLSYSFPENSPPPLYTGVIGWLIAHPNATMYARIGGRRTHSEEWGNSSACIGFFRFCAALYACLVPIALYALYKIPKKGQLGGFRVVL